MESQFKGLIVPLSTKKAIIGSIRGGLEELQNNTVVRGSITGTLCGTLSGSGNLGGTL